MSFENRYLSSWLPWQPLQGSSRNLQIPHLPGLYRIRRSGHQTLDYIGQTGTGTATLRKRLGMLNGVYGKEMPYRAPHTAGPALWALRHRDSIDFEASVMSIIEGDVAWRKGLEALAISLYRQEQGGSPTVNFGRMPAGYRMSSSNDQRLVQAGKRFRGGPTEEHLAQHMPGIVPTGPLDGDPQGADWCGHSWSAWDGLDSALHRLPPKAQGLYRIRGQEDPFILYIGQGVLRARLQAHAKKIHPSGHSQGALFAAAGSLECSWVDNRQWMDHQRLELENDLIASHLLVMDELPTAQFRG